MATLAANALTTVADVKESLNIASSDTTKDNLIIRKINQASDAIEKYCERSFHAADYVEIINGSNIDELVLKQRPVISLTSVEYRTSGINVDSWFTMNSNYYFMGDSESGSGVIKLAFTAKGRWDAWRVTYRAGYETTPTNTIPADLQEACASIAAYYVQNADALVQVQEKQEGQRRIRYYQGITGFKNLLQQLGIEQIIDGYANWPLISE